MPPIDSVAVDTPNAGYCNASTGICAATVSCSPREVTEWQACLDAEHPDRTG